MKKHSLNVSLFSVLCALCAGAISTDAWAAASVRMLGGTGTINGTAAASTSTRSTPTRAGSLRVTPSTARLINTTNTSANTNTATTSLNTSSTTGQRLSIGKYLGGATTATSAGTTPGSAGLSDDVDELDERVDALENAIGSPDVSGGKTLDNRIVALEEAQEAQPTYSTDGVVVVENGVVSIDMDELKKEFFGANDGIAMEYDETTQSIRWGIPDQNGNVADGDWHTLVNTTSLSGEYATADDLATAIDGLATVYLSKADAAETYQKIANLTQTISAESTASQYPSAKAVYDVTKDLAVASNVYTKEEVNTKISAVTGDAGSIAEQLADTVGELGNDGNGDPYTVKGYVDDALADYTTTADLGDLALKNKIEAGDITAGAITNADIAANANIAQSKIDGLTTALAAKQDVIDADNKLAASNVSGLADVATTGKFSDLIEVGTVPANDGHDWVWGYVNGEPQFIRIVDTND